MFDINDLMPTVLSAMISDIITITNCNNNKKNNKYDPMANTISIQIYVILNGLASIMIIGASLVSNAMIKYFNNDNWIVSNIYQQLYQPSMYYLSLCSYHKQITLILLQPSTIIKPVKT